MGRRDWPSGTTRTLSLPRRWIADLLHFAGRVPSIPVQRRMNLGPLRVARAALSQRPSWVTLFTKAYAIVAQDTPELRRAYLTFPMQRIYEHPESVASVAIERDFDGEAAVLFTHLRTPDQVPIVELDRDLRFAKTAPLQRVPSFRRLLRVTQLWRPLRRLAWWYHLNCSGSSRARRFGTFGVSVYSGLGAESLHPISPLTTLLSYGPIEPNGDVTVRIVYDHRTLDGSTIARSLLRLEEVLNVQMTSELAGFETPDATFRRPYGVSIDHGRERDQSLVR